MGTGLGDVAAVDPAFRVDHVRCFAGFFVVADHDVAAADEQLAVLAQPDLDAGHRPADRRGLVVIHGHDGRGPRELAHAPDLVERQSERCPELMNLGTARRGRGDSRRAPVEPDLRAQQHEQRLRALDCRRKLLRNRLSFVAQPVGRDRGGDGALRHLALGLVGFGGDAGPQPRHQLLPDAGDADEKRGPCLDEELEQLIRVGAKPDLVPQRDPSPLRREALGHVREGKVADQCLRLDRPETLHRLERPDDVVV